MTEIIGNGTEFWLTTDYMEPNENVTEEKDMFLVKLLIVLVVMTVGISTMAYLAIRKRRLDQLRHRLMPFYKFEPGEEDEWQTELLEESDTHTFTRLKDYRSTHSVTSVYHDEKCF